MIDRIQRLREVLRARELDGALITHPANRFYLSGYTGHDDLPEETAGVLLIGPDIAQLLVSPNNAGWARAEAKDFEIVEWTRPFIQNLAGRIRSLGWANIGIEEPAISHADYRELAQALGGGIHLANLGTAVGELRAIKDNAEIRALEAVLALNDDVFVAATANLHAGTTERELAWRIEREMRERGAEGPGFETIVAAGPHSGRPHHNPTDRRIEPGEPIVIDMGARLNGYNADLTRTIWVGDPDPKLVEIYAIVDRANRAALAGIRAGITGKEADALARDVISEAGYGDCFAHGLGHGLGIRVHEAPSLAKSVDTRLRAGEVTTIEPGIYLPDWGGVRIEDVGVVTDQGLRVLTRAPKIAPRAS